MLFKFELGRMPPNSSVINVEALRELIRNAQSNDPEKIRAAENGFSQAEAQDGYGYMLAHLVTSKELAQTDRQLSAILLRKFVKHHWDADSEQFEVSA